MKRVGGVKVIRSLVLSGLVLGCSNVDTAEYSTAVAPSPDICDYTQLFGNAEHRGKMCKPLHGPTVVATIVQDVDADAWTEEAGFYQNHAPQVLTFDDFVVVPTHDGFTSVFDRTTDRYHVQTYQWDAAGKLRTRWRADSTWQPVDSIRSFGGWTNGYAQLFQPAIAGRHVWVPGAAGTIQKFNLDAGYLERTVNPFAGGTFDGDARTIVNSALTVGKFGDVYYTVVAWSLTPVPSRGEDPRGAWLVHVKPDDSVELIPWAQLANKDVGIPGRNDLCPYPFGTGGTPQPTGPDSQPPKFGCGLQRPAMNSPIAIDERTGLGYAFTYANNAQGEAHIMVIDLATMTTLRALHTRGHLVYSCGMRLSLGFPNCNVLTAGGTVNLGADPNFNGAHPFRGEDIDSNTPVIAPDGSVAIGAYDGGFTFGGEYDARGSGVIFRPDGTVASQVDFMWDITPSVLRHGTKITDWSWTQARDLYSDFPAPDALSVAQYTPDAQVEILSSVEPDPNSLNIDWVSGQVALDTNGGRYSANGDGHLYQFGADGALVDSVVLPNADGTPRDMSLVMEHGSWDRAGRFYQSHGGIVYVIQSSDRAPQIHERKPASQQRRRGRVMQQITASESEFVEPPEPIAVPAEFLLQSNPANVCVPYVGCQPLQAQFLGNGTFYVSPNVQADYPCVTSCGFQSTCPDGAGIPGKCNRQCSWATGDGWAQCQVSCINNTLLACQTGIEP